MFAEAQSLTSVHSHDIKSTSIVFDLGVLVFVICSFIGTNIPPRLFGADKLCLQ